jgi:TetR/AcrR family transcriptional regulator, cholesterol catabolism regulator
MTVKGTELMDSGIGRRRSSALAEGSAAYAERRNEIIAAAAHVFREKGYRGASLAAVAESLGTDRATLYYYIGSKEELFHEIVHGAAEANAAEAEAIRDSDGSATDKIGRLVTALMLSYARHYPYLYVYIQQDVSHVTDGKSAWSPKMKAIYRRYDEAVVATVQQGIDEGSIRAIGSARTIANGIIGMVNWTHRWYRDDAAGMPSAAEIGETFADLILNGLRTEAPHLTRADPPETTRP